MQKEAGAEVDPGLSPESAPADLPDADARLDSKVRRFHIFAAIACIPLIFPLSGTAWVQFYSHYLLDPPLLAGLLWLLVTRNRASADRTEQRFWNCLVFAFGFWLVSQLSFIAADHWFPEQRAPYEITTNGPFLLLYAGLIAALQVHPHVVDDTVTYSLRLLNLAGSCILVFGLLVYFLVVPGLALDIKEAFWNSSLALFLALDVYILSWLWYLRGVADSAAWRQIYGWLLLATAIWTAGDVALLLMYEQLLPVPGWGTAFDMIWPLAFCAAAVATRTPTPAALLARPEPRRFQPLGMGPLVIYTCLPVVLHVLLYRFGTPDAEFQFMREGIALFTTAILAGMTLLYHRLLCAENQRSISKQEEARERLAHQACHDELTGLPNRNLFNDRLCVAIADATRYQRKCAVLFIDLDQFKAINDSLGHEAGDRTLVATAGRLNSAVRQQDTVARFGGDEFALIMPAVQRPLDAAYLARKLLAAVAEPLEIDGMTHSLTASIGIAVYPDDGQDADALLKNADIAMYQSKIHGRNTYRLFTDAMNEAATERLTIEEGLRDGLMEEQFAVFYQPVVELDSGRPVGFEALLRWRDPRRGYVTPASFIDVAEQSGLIVPIGQWVLETACSWAACQQPINDELPFVSVNLSQRQLREPGIIGAVARVLSETGLAPQQLHLEVTEAAAQPIDFSVTILSKLRELGVRITIDDFGTGYAALSRLQNLPVDVVKIDRSFVKGIEDSSVSCAIVQAIVSMARAMEVYVIAEGVETESELAVVKNVRCHAAQGYLLCEPLPEEKLRETFAGDISLPPLRKSS